MSKTENSTVVVEAAKPYALESGKPESTSTAPPVDAKTTDDVVKPARASTLTYKFEQGIVTWYNPKILAIQFLMAILCAAVTSGIVVINQMTGGLEGQFLTSGLTLFGGSVWIYHGLMDGPLRDAKTGEYLPFHRYMPRACVCGFMTATNLAICIYGHKNLILYKIIVTAACGGSTVIYLIAGLWFLAPIHFLCVMMLFIHFQAFAFYMFTRLFPLWMPYAVMLSNMAQVSLYGWSNRLHLDDTGSVFWAGVICPLVAAYRRVAFVQVIATQAWEFKIFMIVSNIFNSALTPDVKTILYTAMGMKVEVYDVNAMHMLDAISWAADVKFALMMPWLLLFARAFGVEGGDVWQMYQDHFGLILGMYLLQFALCEAAIYGMSWANKFVNLNKGGDERHSVLQIGSQKGTGRYYYSQLCEDMAYYHPYLPYGLNVLEVSFTYFGIEDILKL